MQAYRNSLYLVRIILDALGLVLSFCIAFTTATGDVQYLNSPNEWYLLFAICLVWYFTTKNTGLYDDFRSRNFSYELILLIKNILYQALGVIITLFLLKNNTIPRLFVMYYAVYSLLIIALEKYFIRMFLNYLRKKGRNTRSMLIVGAGRVGLKFYEAVKSNPHFGYKVIGFLDDKMPKSLNGEYIGTIDNLDQILSKKKVENVIVALPNAAADKLEYVMLTCKKYTTRVKIIPDYFKFVSDKYSVSMFGPFPVISVNNEKMNEFHWRLLKRGFDVLFSFLVIVGLLSWVIPIIFIFQLFLDRGPLFYRGVRWGRNGEPFFCLKIRSMKVNKTNSSTGQNHEITSLNDSRITKLGKFIRKTNIDELPQFFNVFIGDMSVVGPRPHEEFENIEIKDKIDLYMWRHFVKPGITGWAQINGYRGGTKKIELMKKRTEYDLWYIENWSFWLDLQIIFLTIWRMIKGDPHAY